ncbi:MAG: hypothetical protein ACRCYX_05690 [Dermatophilaceae bacterium]
MVGPKDRLDRGIRADAASRDVGGEPPARRAAGGSKLDGLLAHLRNVRLEVAPWARRLRSGLGGCHHAGLQLEAATRLIRCFEPAVVPRLPQPDDSRDLIAECALHR